MAAHPRDDGMTKTNDDVLFVATLTMIIDGACFPPSHLSLSGGSGGGDAATNDTGMVELVSVGAAQRKAAAKKYACFDLILQFDELGIDVFRDPPDLVGYMTGGVIRRGKVLKST